MANNAPYTDGCCPVKFREKVLVNSNEARNDYFQRPCVDGHASSCDIGLLVRNFILIILQLKVMDHNGSTQLKRPGRMFSYPLYRIGMKEANHDSPAC